MLPLLLATRVFFHYVGAYRIGVSIDGSVSIPNHDRLPPLQLTLNGGQYTTFLRYDGKFEFKDIPPGTKQ